MANDLDFKIFIRAEADSTAIQAVTRDLAKQSQTAMEAQQAQMRAAAEQQRIAREDSERFSREQRERENATKAFLASLEDKQKALDLARAEEAKRHEQFMREVEAEGKALAEAAAAEALRQKAIDRATAGARGVLGRSREVMDAPPPPPVAKGESDLWKSLSADLQRVGREYDAVNNSKKAVKQSSVELGDVLAALSGGSMMGLVSRLGAVGTVIYGVHQGFKLLIKSSPELEASFDNLTTAAGNFAENGLKKLFDTKELQLLFDAATRAMGGQTEAMKQAQQPLADYLSGQKKLSDQARETVAALNDQADALANSNKLMDETAKMHLKAARAQEDADLAKERARIQNDPGMDPDARTRALADLDFQEKSRATDRQREDNDAEYLRAEEKVREAADRAAKANEVSDAAQRRADAIREFRDAEKEAERYRLEQENNPNFYEGKNSKEEFEKQKAMKLRLTEAQKEYSRLFGDEKVDEKGVIERADILKANAEQANAELEAAKDAAMLADQKNVVDTNILEIKQETERYVQAEKEAAKRAAEKAGADVSNVPAATVQAVPPMTREAPLENGGNEGPDRQGRGRGGRERSRSRYRGLDEEAATRGGRRSRRDRGDGVGGGVFIANTGNAESESDPFQAPMRGVMKNGVVIGGGREGQTGTFSPAFPHMTPLRGASEAILKSNAEMVNMIGAMAGHMGKAVEAVRSGLDKHLQTLRGATMSIHENRHKTTQTMRMVGRIISEQDV